VGIICIKSFSCFFFFQNWGSSKYVGVYWLKRSKHWQAKVQQRNGQNHHIGTFEIEEDAAKAVNRKCQKLNIPLKNPSVGVLDNKTLEKLKLKVIQKQFALRRKLFDQYFTLASNVSFCTQYFEEFKNIFLKFVIKSFFNFFF
jgi:hypothetical protein